MALALAFLYLGIELVFNATLLNTTSALEVDSDAMRRVELFGRTVSGIGFTLLMLSLFAKYRFTLAGGAQKIGALAMLVAGLAPFALASSPAHFALAFVALLAGGIAFLLASCQQRQPRPLATLLSTAIFSWTVMFTSQKLLIEKFLIEPSTWESRLHAQYMTLLKAGLARHVVEVQGAPFDYTQAHAPEERTFLAVFGAIVTRSPSFIEVARSQEDSIIRQVSAAIDYEQLPQRYAEYRRQGEAFQQVWTHYRDASQDYAREIEAAPATARAQYAEALNGLVRGFADYRASAERFARELRPRAEKLAPELQRYFHARAQCKSQSCVDGWDRDYASRSTRFLKKQVPATFWCETRGARVDGRITDGLNTILSAPAALFGAVTGAGPASPPQRFTCNTSENAVQAKLVQLYAHDFEMASGGYPPNIATSEEFIEHPASARRVRSEARHARVVLSDDWRTTDAERFVTAAVAAIRSEADTAWRTQTRAELGGDVPPGLSYPAFVAHPAVQNRMRASLGKYYVPGITFEYSEREFKERVLDPVTGATIRTYLDHLHHRAREFANGGAREEEGKQYLRSVLIPPISLFLSLFFAILTAQRAVLELLSLAWSPRTSPAIRWGAYTPHAIRVALVFVVVLLPLVLPNKFSESRAFRYFSAQAREDSLALAAMADWTIRVQPFLYPIGARLTEQLAAISLPAWRTGVARAAAPPNASGDSGYAVDGLTAADAAYIEQALQAAVRAIESGNEQAIENIALPNLRSIVRIAPHHAEAHQRLVTLKRYFLAKARDARGTLGVSYQRKADLVTASLTYAESQKDAGDE